MITLNAEDLDHYVEDQIHDSEPMPRPREDGRFPGFKATTGRDPIPGKDYNPDGDFCQDDYEFFTGTGAYY